MTELTVEYVGHACLLFSADGEYLLTDPWFTNPVMANSWYQVPHYSRTIDELPTLDYIYISHEHADHLDIPALRRLTPSATIIIPAFGDGKMEKTLSDAALPNRVVSLGDGEVFLTTGGIRLALYFADTGSKDSSLVLEKNGTCIYNHTDNWMTPPKMAKIAEQWDVDIAFQCYAGVGSFPSYMLWPLNHRIEVGAAKKIQLFERMKETLLALRPKTMVPFGASFAYLRPETLWLNEVCATDPTECRNWLKSQGVTIPITLMDHGDRWAASTGVQNGDVRLSLAISAETIAEYSQYYAETIAEKHAEENVDYEYLTLNDVMLEEYLRAWVDTEGGRFWEAPLSIQFSISGRRGTIWTVDFGTKDDIVSKKILPLPNLFLSLTDTELFNGLVHRHYSLTDLYLSSRIQMNRFPYETYHKVFFDSFFWWEEGQQIARNRERASEVGSNWKEGLVR
jgi:L-ascorbate metabolism protein UlaG (beta-lactamase superfamily)